MRVLFNRDKPDNFIVNLKEAFRSLEINTFFLYLNNKYKRHPSHYSPQAHKTQISLFKQFITVNNMDMDTLNPQYITDKTGKKISVILPIKDFLTIMEELEELEDIKLYDEAKKSSEPSIPIDDAFKMIEANRKTK